MPSRILPHRGFARWGVLPEEMVGSRPAGLFHCRSALGSSLFHMPARTVSLCKYPKNAELPHPASLAQCNRQTKVALRLHNIDSIDHRGFFWKATSQPGLEHGGSPTATFASLSSASHSRREDGASKPYNYLTSLAPRLVVVHPKQELLDHSKRASCCSVAAWRQPLVTIWRPPKTWTNTMCVWHTEQRVDVGIWGLWGLSLSVPIRLSVNIYPLFHV